MNPSAPTRRSAGLDEAGERARLLAGPHDVERGVGQVGAGAELGGERLGVVPAVDALRLWTGQGVDVTEGEALDPIVGLVGHDCDAVVAHLRSEEHTSELQSLMRISYAVFCL